MHHFGAFSWRIGQLSATIEVRSALEDTMKYAFRLSILGLILAQAAAAQDELDWIKSRVEEDLGISRGSTEVMADGTRSRADLVNFTMSAEVRAIDDGDTIDVVGKGGARFVIRLSDIDTPEVSHKPYINKFCECDSTPFRPGQPGGQAATVALEKLVSLGDVVRLECYEPDQYGRFACHVFKGDVNVNLEQIRSGWGWLPSKAEWIRDPESKKAEDEAKAAKLGAWSLEGQIAPGDWRKQCWGSGSCEGAENWPVGP